MATPSKNPLSIRDIRKMKDLKRKSEVDKIRIYNITKLQMVNIQMYGKTSKLVSYQQSIQIPPGRSADLPEARLIPEQITNLKRTGFIRTVKIDSKTDMKENTEILFNISVEIKPNKIKIKPKK